MPCSSVLRVFKKRKPIRRKLEDSNLATNIRSPSQSSNPKLTIICDSCDFRFIFIILKEILSFRINIRLPYGLRAISKSDYEAGMCVRKLNIIEIFI